jgi:hypothetical protein
MYLNQYPEYVLPKTKRVVFPPTLFTIKGKNTPRAWTLSKRKVGECNCCQRLTEEEAMPVRLLVRTRQLSLISFLLVLQFFGWEAHFSMSLAQESILDQGPPPDSVKGLSSPLDIPFIPLAPAPWLFTRFRDGVRDTLRPQLEPLPSFFRDTRLTFKPRMY